MSSYVHSASSPFKRDCHWRTTNDLSSSTMYYKENTNRQKSADFVWLRSAVHVVVVFLLLSPAAVASDHFPIHMYIQEFSALMKYLIKFYTVLKRMQPKFVDISVEMMFFHAIMERIFFYIKSYYLSAKRRLCSNLRSTFL